MVQSHVGGNPNPDPTSEKSRGPLPEITLPKGGGAVRGLGEQFSVRSLTGTSSLTVPLGLTTGRSGFTPDVSLAYDSGSGNGAFGLGWNLTIPSVSRKTDKGLPRYRDEVESDTFEVAGSEALVPYAGQETRMEGDYLIRRYRPRVESAPSRIERWERPGSGESFWKIVSANNVTNLYGITEEGRVCDPSDPERIFQWLLEETADDKGNVIRYGYKREDKTRIDRQVPQECNRAVYAGSYLKTIHYGNREPHIQDGWHYTVVFDYGEHDSDRPALDEVRPWPCRRDPFSSCRSGFEIRTLRLCRRVLLFHRFDELGEAPCLVRSLALEYEEGPAFTFLTQIVQNGHVRRTDGGYDSKSMPPIAFAYSKPSGDLPVQTLDDNATENLPEGLSGPHTRWLDLFGEGLSGIVTENGDTWYYKRNNGDGRFAPLQSVAAKPAPVRLGTGDWQLTDLQGDGGSYAVQYNGSTPGYYALNPEGEWEPFQPIAALPNVDWSDPNIRFIDVTGDGKPDLLVAEQDVFTIYASHGKTGFGSGEKVPLWDEELRGSALVFSDRSQSIHLADMNGDGLADLVRVRNGEVCYWPNLGYGKFGAQIVMEHSPRFAHPDLYDSKRIRFFDIDGSGPADLVYLDGKQIAYWLNQSGNGWSEPQDFPTFPYPSTGVSVDVVDLLGSGTACLVWSSSLPADAERPLRYVDLTGGVKPHLLTSVINHMGSEIHIGYDASTRHYLRDQAANRPWATRLPFPVHVVSRVERVDRIGGNRLVTRYAYHHGYYDREERAFRGFGSIDQWDAESYGEEADAGSLVRIPPIRTVTWHHTGAYFQRHTLAAKFAEEYYREQETNDGDLRTAPLGESVLPEGLSVLEEMEACRALKGLLLRTEVYAEDGTEKSRIPFTVSERNYTVERLQPKGDHLHAVFRTHGRESWDAHYERNAADPRVAHEMTLETDGFGHVLQSVAIAYGRRRADPALSPEDRETQGKTHVVLNVNRYSNAVDRAGAYRNPERWETRTYELSGVESAADARFDVASMRLAAESAAEIPYELEPDGTLQKRLLEASRTLYRRDDLAGPLAEGTLESLAIPYETYRMAFTPGLWTEIYGDQGTAQDWLTEGGYVRFGGDPQWWMPSGVMTYPEGAANRFFLPDGFADAAGNAFTVTYDAYGLMAVRSVDPLGSTLSCEIDYRVMQPCRVTDPNGNRSSVCFDALGLVTGTAVAGKDGERVGDSLDGFIADLDDKALLQLLENPLKDPHQWLRRASSRIVYDLDRFRRSSQAGNPQPIAVCSLVRETHDSDLSAGETTSVSVECHYADGFGRTIQTKRQAKSEGATDVRWTGTGWTVFNDKGKPFRIYEPFFSSTHHYEAIQAGVCTTLLYDPAGRQTVTLRPNHTYEKVVYDPWRQIAWDVNDTIHPTFRYDPRAEGGFPDPAFNPADDPDVGACFRGLPASDYLPTWYQVRMEENKALAKWPDRDPVTGRPIEINAALRAEEGLAARKAAKHAATPTVVYSDSLGRPFLTVEDNGKDADGIDQFLLARTYPDIQGRTETWVDALGRIVKTARYDMAGRSLREHGMDDGIRLMLPHADGKALYAWNSRGYRSRLVYDPLRRLAARYVSQADGPEMLAERTVYGEIHPDSKLSEQGVPVSGRLNMRGQVWFRLDGAGIVRNVSFDPSTGQETAFDFKGNSLTHARRLVRDYKNAVDWTVAEPAIREMETAGTDLRALLDEALNPLLESESFDVRVRYDALNRPVRLSTPDGSEYRPVFRQAGLLDQVMVRLRGGGNPETVFVERVDYDAKGQRERIVYGNGATTVYQYEPETFRKSRIVTFRSADVLQDLRYVYDPVGNICVVRDSAQQSIYYDNQVVSAGNDYDYDALYRLTGANGREHIGSSERPHVDYDDGPRMNHPHPSDGAAMRTYREIYQYDMAGNLIDLLHQGGSGGTWHRIFRYEEPSLIEPGRANNRLSGSAVGSIAESYAYDPRGNMIRLPHLGSLQWDDADRLREADLGGGGTAYYQYDSSGERVRKVIERLNGTRQKERLYLGGFEVYREYGGDGRNVSLERETLHVMDDKQRIAMVDTRTAGNDGSPETLVRYQMEARLESCALELDEQARILTYEEYYPFGGTSFQAVRTDLEVPRKRYRHSLKERDEESGFCCSGMRYYAPWLARWTSCDPAGFVDGTNRYAYVRNNPVTFRDSTGMYAEAGHYYTVYFVALAAGLDEDTAYKSAFFAQMPDEVTEFDAKHLQIVKVENNLSNLVTFHDLIANTVQGFTQFQLNVENDIRHTLGLPPGPGLAPRTPLQALDKQVKDTQRGLHALTGGRVMHERGYRDENLRSMTPGSLEFGLNLHALGDSYAHTQMDNGNRYYTTGLGHARHLTAPDEAENRPGLYLQYVDHMYTILSDFAKQQGKPLRLSREEVITVARDVAAKEGDEEQIAMLRTFTEGMTEVKMRKYAPEKEGLFDMPGFAAQHPEEVPNPDALLYQSIQMSERWRYQGSFGK